MNRSALKSYAPKARLDFIRAVTDRAALHGLTTLRTEPMQETGDVVIISGRAFPKVVASQRRSLEGRIRRQGFDQVMEAMAYTWFNRFVALRYMELHGYLDHGYRVLSHSEDKPTPEILEHAEHLALPGLDNKKVIDLKLDGTKEAELYRLLLIAQCHALSAAMPFLFERIDDETELLLPDNLLHSDSVIRKLVNELDEGDWQQVEIIGWLYQFYISDKKDEVIGKVVKSEDIPAATQLFTPNWIVKYLVQNTLGRQWLATYPDSPLRQQMEYYIEPAEQTDDVKAQLAAITPKSLDPERLTLLDPASGSGHILVEAYDLFKAIYQERGYRSKDIPRLILEKNLFGLEIDDRAAQLAAFALLMKARADDRRIFADRIQPNVLAIQESNDLESLLRPDPAAAAAVGELPFADSDLFPQTQKQLTLNKPTQGSPLVAVEPCLRELIKLFESGKTFGSLIGVPPALAAQLPAARQNIEAMIAKGQLWEHRAAALLLPLVRQAELLAKRYDTVVTNPPYMGSKGMNLDLKQLAERAFPRSKSDLFAMFVERIADFLNINAFSGVMTPFTWMFIGSYEAFRSRLINECAVLSLVQPEYHAFFDSAYVPICAFTFQNSKRDWRADFINLTEFYGEELQPQKTLEAIHIPSCGWRFVASRTDLLALPGCPFAYWVSPRVRSVFRLATPLGDIANPRQGSTLGENDKYLRLWHEVSSHRIPSKWKPCLKGGKFRKWFGSSIHVVNWENNGWEIKQSGRATIRNEELLFNEGIEWSRISSSTTGFRLFDRGYFFESASGVAFPQEEKRLRVLGFLNSKIAAYLISCLNPTLSCQSGDIAKLPFLDGDLETPVSEMVALAREDSDRHEVSRNFQRIPLLADGIRGILLQDSFATWCQRIESDIERMRLFEEANNRVCIAAYGLEQELKADVAESEVTLTRADREQDMRRLISYAIGCMMGRYSLDKPGLVYARSRNEGFDPSQHRTFPADAYGIISITELAWFPDDATERFIEFIGKAWPREHLEDNLKFIADSLGPNRDEHPRHTIRRYLAVGFYKDHLQAYRKRPIYWLFSSGKQRAFQCLVYLHRYHESTLARMRTEYVIPLQGKLSHRIEQLAGDIAAATSTSHRRKLEKERETLVKQRTELAAFDEKLRHCADQRIALDLDDGVKVNYGKFGDLLAEVKSVTGGTEE